MTLSRYLLKSLTVKMKIPYRGYWEAKQPRGKNRGQRSFGPHKQKQVICFNFGDLMMVPHPFFTNTHEAKLVERVNFSSTIKMEIDEGKNMALAWRICAAL